MSKVITFDKGSKRRLKQIRWKVIEVFSLLFLAFVVLLLSAFYVLWEVHREHPYPQPTKELQIEKSEPEPQ